jgi:YHS domain-containing protein
MKGECIMAQTYKDPVCGMEVTVETAASKSEYKGHTYYKETFDKNPEKYISQKNPA